MVLSFYMKFLIQLHREWKVNSHLTPAFLKKNLGLSLKQQQKNHGKEAGGSLKYTLFF